MAETTYGDIIYLLRDVAEFLDDYSDVDDGDDGQPVANKAMALKSEVERMIEEVDRWR